MNMPMATRIAKSGRRLMAAHMAACGPIGNAAPTNGQVDKTGACPDACWNEQWRRLFRFRPDHGLVVARAFPCGGAMARLVIA